MPFVRQNFKDDTTVMLEISLCEYRSLVESTVRLDERVRYFQNQLEMREREIQSLRNQL